MTNIYEPEDWKVYHVFGSSDHRSVALRTKDEVWAIIIRGNTDPTASTPDRMVFRPGDLNIKFFDFSVALDEADPNYSRCEFIDNNAIFHLHDAIHVEQCGIPGSMIKMPALSLNGDFGKYIEILTILNDAIPAINLAISEYFPSK